MPTTSVNIGFRPPRVATLVRRGSLADVAEAAAANTHVWGGCHNPLVAVGEDIDAAIDEVRLFKPDLVTVINEPTPEQSAVLDAMKHLGVPTRSREPFEQLDSGAMPYADIRLICRHHYETTFRFGVVESRATMVEWPDGDGLDPYMTVLFGRYRTGKRGEAFRRAFTEGLSATVVGTDDLAAAGGAVTPLGLTASSLSASLGSRAAGVVAGPSTSASTLLTFWNLRSVGCDVVLWPTDQSGPIADYSRHVLNEALERWSRRAQGFTLSLWIDEGEGSSLGASQEPPEDLVAALAKAGASWACGLSTPALWISPTATPCVWAAQPRAVLASIETQGNGEKELVAALPPHPFSPAGVDRLGRPQWLVTIRTYRPTDLGQHTFEIPSIATLTPWASRSLRIIGDVRLESQGVAVFEDVDATSTTLKLIDKRAVIQRMFVAAGLTATTSPAGEAADRIIRQMDGLWGCRKLRLHGLRALLASGSRAWTWTEAMRHLHHNGAYSRYRNVPQASDLLRSLIDRGALQAVFSLACPSCAVRSDHRLDDLGNEMTCPRCSQPFDPGPTLEQGKWKYRPSGFFATLSSHGSLPVVLTMIRMLETLHMREEMIDGSYDIAGDGWKEECDFVALWRDRDGGPVMAIGECKGGKRAIERSDVIALRRIADAVRSLGVECYIVFATTRDDFTEAEAALFRQLRDDFAQHASLDGDYQGPRVGPVLLAADQLDFHEPAPFALLDKLPERYLDGMAALARNTLAIHLDPETSKLFQGGREMDGLFV